MITIFRNNSRNSWWTRQVVYHVNCVTEALEWVDTQPKIGYIFYIRGDHGDYKRIYRNRRQSYLLVRG